MADQPGAPPVPTREHLDAAEKAWRSAVAQPDGPINDAGGRERAAFLAGYAAALAWIPCSERMPEAHVEVLFVLARESGGIVCMGQWNAEARDWADLDTDAYNDRIRHGEGEVTHWMPKPAPPTLPSARPELRLVERSPAPGGEK